MFDHDPPCSVCGNEHYPWRGMKTSKPKKWKKINTLGFGKHTDKKITEIPLSYLCWIILNVQNRKEIQEAAKKEYKSRGFSLRELYKAEKEKSKINIKNKIIAENVGRFIDQTVGFNNFELLDYDPYDFEDPEY